MASSHFCHCYLAKKNKRCIFAERKSEITANMASEDIAKKWFEQVDEDIDTAEALFKTILQDAILNIRVRWREC